MFENEIRKRWRTQNKVLKKIKVGKRGKREVLDCLGII